MSEQEAIARFVAAWIATVPELRSFQDPLPGPWVSYPYPEVQPVVEELAQELVEMAEFRALQLGTWLGTTDGQVVEQAVAIVIPPYYRWQYALVVKALMLAADLQRERGKKVAGACALGVLVLGGLWLIATRPGA